jgi:hypothetical protein
MNLVLDEGQVLDRSCKAGGFTGANVFSQPAANQPEGDAAGGS